MNDLKYEIAKNLVTKLKNDNCNSCNVVINNRHLNLWFYFIPKILKIDFNEGLQSLF